MADTDEKKAESAAVPDQLFHTILTVVNRRGLPASANHEVHVLESHGTLAAAKSYATGECLKTLGLEPQEFTLYAVKPTEQTEVEDWPYGDGVLVFGRAPTGSEMHIAIETGPNQESLTMRPDGRLFLPDGAQFLHYILQTSIDYNVDRCGCRLTTEIIGAYVHRQNAWVAAHKALDRDQFVQYDDSHDPQFVGQWPFGEDVAVHAIAETGQNCFVAVQKPLWAHQGRTNHVTRSLAMAEL
ncbi:hypothetical protein MY4824_003573 [Beauveria thailandica]